jgi:hypothetical protein
MKFLSEIVMCIENAVMSRRMNLDEVPENASRLRRLTAGHLISEEKFNRLKVENRLIKRPIMFSGACPENCEFIGAAIDLNVPWVNVVISCLCVSFFR